MEPEPEVEPEPSRELEAEPEAEAEGEPEAVAEPQAETASAWARLRKAVRGEAETAAGVDRAVGARARQAGV